MRPFGFARIFKSFQITANRGFANFHRVPQVRYRNEAMLANQFAQFDSSDNRSVQVIGGDHRQQGRMRIDWRVRIDSEGCGG